MFHKNKILGQSRINNLYGNQQITKSIIDAGNTLEVDALEKGNAHLNHKYIKKENGHYYYKDDKGTEYKTFSRQHPMTDEEITIELDNREQNLKRNNDGLRKQMEHNEKMHSEKFDDVKIALPKIMQGLSKQGLAIKDISVRKSGLNDNWNEGDVMQIAISAIPTSNKIKFINFAGYTESGSGRNEKKLQEKADALKTALKESTGLSSVSVNRNSFQINEGGGSNRILIDFWL